MGTQRGVSNRYFSRIWRLFVLLRAGGFLFFKVLESKAMAGNLFVHPNSFAVKKFDSIVKKSSLEKNT